MLPLFMAISDRVVGAAERLPRNAASRSPAKRDAALVAGNWCRFRPLKRGTSLAWSASCRSHGRRKSKNVLPPPNRSCSKRALAAARRAAIVAGNHGFGHWAGILPSARRARFWKTSRARFIPSGRWPAVSTSSLHRLKTSPIQRRNRSSGCHWLPRSGFQPLAAAGRRGQQVSELGAAHPITRLCPDPCRAAGRKTGPELVRQVLENMRLRRLTRRPPHPLNWDQTSPADGKNRLVRAPEPSCVPAVRRFTMNETAVTSYDEIPYDSKPLYSTHPDCLATAARLRD